MADKKHILFISSWYPTASDPTLGIFNMYFSRAAALRNSVSVLNVVSDPELDSRRELNVKTEFGMPVIEVRFRKISSRLSVLAHLLKWKHAMSAFIAGYKMVVKRYGKPDLIHLNVAMPKGPGVLLISKKFKIPYVVNENWSGYTKDDGSYKGLIQKYFTRKIIRGAGAILPTSNYLKAAMLSHGLSGNYHVIPNVVDVNLFRPLEAHPKVGTRLIHISSLNDREKNVSGLIRGFAKAVRQQPDLFLEIVGEGVDRKKYQQLVVKEGLDASVSFSGRLFGDDLVSAINASDALIMFSHFETFCLVNIEAFACGKPVITSDAGAIPEYMVSSRGYLVPRGNEEALANTILRFVKEKDIFDASAIRQYAVENYSYEVIGEKLDTIYRDVLKEK